MTNETSRELLANALKRRTELQFELDALESLIRTYSALLNLREAPVEEPQLDLRVAGRTRQTKAVYLSRLIDEVRKALLAEGRPLKRSALLQKLREQGFEVEGTDKSKVLGTNIWRSGKFNHIDGQGYWPIDLPIPRI